MKILPILKTVGIAVLTVGISVGCASQQQKPSQPAPAEQMNKAQMAQDAIAAAKAANAKAKALDYEWRDAGKMIKKAEALAKAGKYDEAIKLANAAKLQGELAVKQYNKESKMDRSQRLSPHAAGSYTVMRGDCLWNIAAKSDIYGNPYEWPLIYKANSGKIKDADLIYPGQVFAINTDPTSAEVAAAVHHAKTRGAWTLGTVEASDKAYLAGK